MPEAPLPTVTPATLSMAVIARAKDAVYLRLPRELQRDCDGGCACDHCRKEPALAKWDTLVVPTKPFPRGGHDWSYTVHLPDPAIPAFCEYLKRSGK